MSAKIELTQGKIARVDDGDLALVSQHKWRAIKSYNTFYAIADVRKEKKHTVLLMHRLILGLNDSEIHTDHINHNGLDNRRTNLRICTNAENQHNSTLSARNKSGYKGVSWKRGKWRAQITVGYKRIDIGFYDLPEDAARAYDAMAIENFGEFAATNVALGLLPINLWNTNP